MITIKEHNGKRVLSNYNYNAVEKEILRSCIIYFVILL